VDLGLDAAKAYRVAPSSKKWELATELDIKVNAGAGARHMDGDREWLVLIGELSGELFLFRKIKDRFQQVDVASLGAEEMSAAAIRMHANGRFIYCSERNTNGIFTFVISSNKLQLIGKVSSGGRTPRDISIDPSGKWLLAANQDDSTICVFSINDLTGELQYVYSCAIATPSCICWQRQDNRTKLLNERWLT
jgi:6-phosphogluconolactonase